MNNLEILKIRFWSDDLNKKISIREYFRELLAKLWYDGENFSAKRPFGNSDWQSELYMVLVKNKLVEGKIDEYGCLDEVDYLHADTLIQELIEEL